MAYANGVAPPKVGVPGVYQPPVPPPARMQTVRQPGWRELTVPRNTNLREVAMRVYGNTAEWIRVYNDNRHVLQSPNEEISAGTTLRIS